MSRHSHWATIKRAKGAADARKAAVFTKLSRTITVAAREKGTDPVMNFKLRLAIDAARAANMTKDTIERAIARATGGDGSAALEEVTYEAMGPGGVGFIIDTVTDNHNRTGGKIKATFSKYGGSLAAIGAVKWQFDRRGVVRVSIDVIPKDREAFELTLIDHGAEDVKEEEGGLTIATAPDAFPGMVEYLESQKIAPEYSAVTWVPKNTVTVDDETVREQLEAITDALDEDDDVADYATNQA